MLHKMQELLINIFQIVIFFLISQALRNLLKELQKKKKIDYLVICAPNYLHNKFILFGLKNKINVICEKPLILKTAQLKNILIYEKKYKKKVFCIMQLRLNTKIIKFRDYLIKKIKNKPSHIVKCNIRYITYRGDWFLKTWKGNISKSGGLTTNIGIHLFDLLSWFFDDPIEIKVKKNDNKTSVGQAKFKNAHVEWLISISEKYLNKTKPNERSIREFSFNNKNLELSNNFTNMHILSYKKILDGKGFRIKDVEKSLYITEKLRKLS